MKIVNGRVFNGASLEDRTVYVNDERIVDSSSYIDDGIIIDANGSVVAPGLIDLHFHGCMGQDFCNGTQDAISTIASYQASQGVTAICPATMTFMEETLAPIMEAAAAFEPSDTEAALVGINMEGPFISPNKVGAQNPLYVQDANENMLARLQQKSGGLIKFVDVAPEQPGCMKFIQRTSDEVCISVAHTCADYDTAVTAFQAGARHITHLFNAMPGLHHRKPGPIAAAAERDDVTAEIICDGIHVHPSMVRLAFKLFGPERMVMISDTVEAAGLEDGEYMLGGQEITVCGKRATLHNGTIAGGNTNLAHCLKIAVKEMGIPLEDALLASSTNPAQALGISHERGSLDIGKIADIILLDDELNVVNVVLRGKSL